MKKSILLFPTLIFFILFAIINCGEDETVNQPPPTPTETVWKEIISMPTARWGHSAAIIDGKIYVIGGSNTTGWNAEAINTVEVYDPVTNSWDVNKAPLPTARIFFGTCVINGKIYTIGGRIRNGGLVSNIIEVYDPLTDTWDATKAPMPKPRASAGCCVINGKIYVIGGNTGGANWFPHKDLQIYDSTTDTWDTTKAAMHNERMGLIACALNNNMYVIGGTNEYPYPRFKKVEVYDLTNNVWTYKSDMQDGRINHTLNFLDGMIYAIGGTDPTNSGTCSVEIYDPSANNWTNIEMTPIWINRHASCVFQEKIYIIGGSTTDGGNTPTASNKVYSFDPSLIE